MTHTVKSGDTLAKIARTHGISLEQLLDANPRFRANPNRISIGDILNNPGGQSGPVVQPPLEPQPQPQPSAARVLGNCPNASRSVGEGPGPFRPGGETRVACRTAPIR